MSGLPRDILKWLQSLDLTFSVKNTKWDLSNGYLIAEIFSWYYPQYVQIYKYGNNSVLRSKVMNWNRLREFFKRCNLNIPYELIDGTMHCKEGASGLLMQVIYELLSNRQVKGVPPEHPIDLTDHAYQLSIPIHARSTALMAIRSNIRQTELLANWDIVTNQQKAQRIIDRHVDDRLDLRLRDPVRFNHIPTLGELAPRRSPVPEAASAASEEKQGTTDNENESNNNTGGNFVRLPEISCRN